MRLALCLSRLEVRRRRPLRRYALGARRVQLRRTREHPVVSVHRARRPDPGVSRTAGVAARAAGARMAHRSPIATLRRQAHPRDELFAGARGRARFESRRVLAQVRPRSRSHDERIDRHRSHARSFPAALRGGRIAVGSLGGRVARNAERRALLARHAVHHAVVHDHPAVFRSPAGRARLRADRRRAHVVHQLVFLADDTDFGSRPGVLRERRRHPLAEHSRHVRTAREQEQQLSDRPRGAARTPLVQRRRRHRRARRGGSRKHGVPIQDRTRERLGSSDTAIIRTRKLLLRCARELRDAGTAPPALAPADQEVRAAAFMLAPDEPFEAHAYDAMRVRAGQPYVFASPANPAPAT